MQCIIMSFPFSTTLYRLHNSSMPALHPGRAASMNGRIEDTLSSIIVSSVHIEWWTWMWRNITQGITSTNGYTISSSFFLEEMYTISSKRGGKGTKSWNGTNKYKQIQQKGSDKPLGNIYAQANPSLHYCSYPSTRSVTDLDLRSPVLFLSNRKRKRSLNHTTDGLQTERDG
jgi:hypothetical protein